MIALRYFAGNRSEEEHIIAQHWVSSTSRVFKLQKQKQNYVLLAKESNGSLKVLTIDLQRVLLLPSLKVSALYYLTNLCVQNFSIFDCILADARFFVWHEAEEN